MRRSCLTSSLVRPWDERSDQPFSPFISPHGMLRLCSTPCSVHPFPPAGMFSSPEPVAPLAGSPFPAGRRNPVIFGPKSLIFKASF